jgi:two-component system response regulator TctD
MSANGYDAIAMDLRLPDKHGLVLLREMRNRNDRMPVLLLTAQGALQDRVRGLNLGADDFLTKPFALEELEARLMALVRRSRDRQSPSLQCGSLSFDIESRAFTLNGTLLPLTPREHAALAALLVRTSYPVDKTQLFDKVFSQDSDASLDAIEVVLHRLRKKLAGSDVRIVTVRGLGYMLEHINGEPESHP